MSRSKNPFPYVSPVISDTFRCALAMGVAYRASLALDPPTDLPSLIPWGFLGLLVAGFGVALFRYRQPYARAARALHEAVREFRTRQAAGDQARVAGGEPGRQVEETEEASRSGDGYADLRPRAFADHRPLLNAWNAFCAARQGHGASVPGRGRSTAWPADYFTVAKVLGRDLGSLPNALPGVFTAVGLLGTFVGIAIGLADIEPTAATEDLMEGIRTLMGGMSTAFLTSIVGIAWSVWWLFEFRLSERKLKSRLDLFIAETTRIFHVEEPHETLVRVAGANERVQHTTKAIERTAKDIKGNVQSLGQDLADALEPYFEKHIGEPIRNLNTDLGRRQTEALGRMVEAFRDTLVSSVKEELNEFGQALRAASDHQAKAARELEGFFARLVEVSEVQMKLLSRTTEVATVFDRGLAALTAATEATEAAGESARDTMASARQAMDIARGLTEESRQHLEFQKAASEAARRSWDAQSSLLEEMQANFGRLATDLGDKIMEFQTASAQKISEVFHVFDSEMAKVVDHLGGTLAELRDATEELPGTVGGLRETAQDLANTSQAQRDTLAEGLRAFEETKTELVGALEQTRADLQDLGRALPVFARSADSLHGGIEALADGMKATGARSEENFGRLADTIEAGAGRVAQVVDSAERSVTEALAKVSSGRQVPATEETEPSEVADRPLTKSTDESKTASRDAVDTAASRDGEHAPEVTEAPPNLWRRLLGRRR